MAATSVRPGMLGYSAPRPPPGATVRPPLNVTTPPRKLKPSSHANRAKNVALSALTGGIMGLPSQDQPPPGFLTAGGGGRKVIPELVLPFQLPVAEAQKDQESEPLEKRYAPI